MANEPDTPDTPDRPDILDTLDIPKKTGLKRGPKLGSRKPRPEGTLSKKRRMYTKAIIALMEQPTLPAAARAVGIHENSLRAWLADEEFTAMLHQAQDDALGHAIVKINGRIAETVEVLHQIVMDESISPAARVSAVIKELDISLRTMSARYQETTIQKLTEEIEKLKGKEQNAEGNVIEGETPQRSRTGRFLAASVTDRSEEDRNEGEDQGT